jgi:hypothetical protein
VDLVVDLVYRYRALSSVQWIRNLTSMIDILAAWMPYVANKLRLLEAAHDLISKPGRKS